MNFTPEQLWDRYKKFYFEFPSIHLSLDLSRMNFPGEYLESTEPKFFKAFAHMAELEKGGIANPDEKRMVGHYWLRKPSLAPTPTITNEILENITAIKEFAAQIHSGNIRGQKGPFTDLLLIGIGGSALGPQFLANALEDPRQQGLNISFLDNTDPDGFERVLTRLNSRLGQTLCLVISKSGGTKETRNGMLAAEAAYAKAGLTFAAHAVAVTGRLSELDKTAQHARWIRNFPMWDWVGGRTSLFSAVGLLPAALQGFDVDALLAGAAACDSLTRTPELRRNPSALLASMWFYIGEGRGSKDMVVLPYKDRLELFSRYLQQLIMESLGKELDLNGKPVHQGIAVYGNKGSTDQHAYVQQLREGPLNFFVTFIQVLNDGDGFPLFVEPNVTSGDYLLGFALGTRQALYEKGRESLTLTLEKLSPFTVGVLIALFERAVGLYAHLVNINAYHQPGVEAGKKAANAVIELQRKVIQYLKSKPGHELTSSQIASGIGAHAEYENVFHICQHLSANPDRGFLRRSGPDAFSSTFTLRT